MNQPRDHQSFLDAMDRNERLHRTGRSFETEVNPLQKALNDYNILEHERDTAMAQASELRIANGALVAEVNMLREQVRVSDRDRMRLQAVASTFAGHARSLSAILNDILAVSIKNGVEATEKVDTGLEQAGKEVQAVLQRVEPVASTSPPERPMTSPRAPHAVGTPIPPNAGLMRV